MKDSDRLISLLDSLDIDLGQEVVEKLLWFLEELYRWNRRINLTAITDPLEGIEKHLVDSLTLLPLLEGTDRLLDIGSGGGFPCIPLKLAKPSLEILSVDAVAKKISFQRHVARTAGMEGFEALHLRAEKLPELKGCAEGFDAVVSRAFSSLPVFAALALPCLAPSGRILAMKGAEGEQELVEALPELTALGLRCVEVRKVTLPLSGARRVLIVLKR